MSIVPQSPASAEPSNDPDRSGPGPRKFLVAHRAFEHYNLPWTLDEVIRDEMEMPPDEELVVWDQGRLAAAILLADVGPRLVRFDYPEPEVPDDLFRVWDCPDRVTFTLSNGSEVLYLDSRLGLTIDRVIAEQMDDYRLGMAWCAERGLEHPAEDRSIWEEDRLAAVIFHRPDGPEVIRFFEDEPESKGGGR